MEEAKKIIRRALPYWDPRKLCGWLEEMARKGYYLKDNGIRFGIATFVQGDPAEVHYLADPTEKEKAIFSKDWEYKATWRKLCFYVSRVSRPTPLHHHPDISRQAWRKRNNSTIFRILFFHSLFLFNVYVLFRKGQPLFVVPSAFLTCFALLILLMHWMLFGELRQFFVSHKIQKELVDFPADFSQPPKKQGAGHRFSVPVFQFLLLFAIFIPMLLSLYFANGEIVAPSLPQTPLITMEGYQGDWIMVPDEQGTYHYWEYSNFLAPRSVHWTEYGELYHREEISSADSGDSAAIYVSYHETAFPFIARTLANRYLRSDLLHRDKYKVESSGLPVDQIWIFSDQDPYFLLQDGRIVVRVRMETNKEESFTQEELLQWAKCLVESIDGKG